MPTEIDRLANFILREFPGEPGKYNSESAVDVAIRLLRNKTHNSAAREYADLAKDRAEKAYTDEKRRSPVSLDEDSSDDPTG